MIKSRFLAVILPIELAAIAEENTAKHNQRWSWTKQDLPSTSSQKKDLDCGEKDEEIKAD